MPSAPAQWAHLLTECLDALEREQIGSPCPVVDHEVLPSPTGDGNDFTVWLICRSAKEGTQFADTELSRFQSDLRRHLLARGFPEDGLASLALKVTDRTTVAMQGGRISS
jgi:hypothetical protein